MAIITWRETLTEGFASGNTIFPGTGRVSCINARNRVTLPCCYFYPGLTFKITILGTMSSPATGGSVRFQVCMGAGSTDIVFDTQVVPLVAAARPSRPLELDIDLVCRTVGVGTATTFFPTAKIQSETLIGSAVNTSGGNTSLIVPTVEPTEGAGTDNTIASTVDIFCMLAGQTPNFTVNNYRLEALG